MHKTNKSVADLGGWNDKIRSYANPTKSIACLYEDKNYVPWGGCFPQDPNSAGELSSSPTATISSIKFVRAERECSRNAYSNWVSETSTKALGFGDMNGDRKADMIVRDDVGRLIGTGGWNAMNALARHGDFSGDGREDLVAREASTGKLWFYPGTSAGSLGGRVLAGKGGWNAMANLVAVGDFSGDGRPDLATVTNEKYVIDGYPGHLGWLVTYRGQGNGLLSSGTRTDGEWWGLNGLCQTGRDRQARPPTPERPSSRRGGGRARTPGTRTPGTRAMTYSDGTEYLRSRRRRPAPQRLGHEPRTAEIPSPADVGPRDGRGGVGDVGRLAGLGPAT
ncbi:FG-GAP-like repeat-containing protein [Streptomyces sp. NPDC006134]|uniref:FG-GAP-like repeat-containing protein n=1 Tax=Streptomyces sp. NPDC006134 TaxID=3154467 RepID=UPI0033D82F48